MANTWKCIAEAIGVSRQTQYNQLRGVDHLVYGHPIFTPHAEEDECHPEQQYRQSQFHPVYTNHSTLIYKTALNFMREQTNHLLRFFRSFGKCIFRAVAY